tara:strand:+ start:135 stop:755 length:621 start_codon:yes stop_codon:yes gene_type:complete
MADQLKKSILDFRTQIGELARPNLFQVQLSFPTIGTDGSLAGGNTQDDADKEPSFVSTDGTQLSTFMIKAAQLPASTIGVVNVPFRGRQLKIAGDRTFEPWTITVLNDENFRLRRQFEAWAAAIQDYRVNISGSNTIGDYQKDARVQQFDRKGVKSKEYHFESIWPSNISAIDLDWESNDTPEEYTVEFQVQYWTPVNMSNTANTD